MTNLSHCPVIYHISITLIYPIGPYVTLSSLRAAGKIKTHGEVEKPVEKPKEDDSAEREFQCTQVCMKEGESEGEGEREQGFGGAAGCGLMVVIGCRLT